MKRLALIVIFISAIALSAFAQIPRTINYQGRLMDTSGQAVADGQYDVLFRLYTAAAEGSMEWEESQKVVTQAGYFNTVLGNAVLLDPAKFNQPLWLGIKVGNENEMTPRQPLGASPYAMTVANGAITTEKIADGAKISYACALSAPDGFPKDAVYVDNEGNVGIGAKNLETKLNVIGSSQVFSDNGKNQDNNWWTLRKTGICFEVDGKIFELVFDGRYYEDNELGIGEVITTSSGDHKVPVGIMRIK